MTDAHSREYICTELQDQSGSLSHVEDMNDTMSLYISHRIEILHDYSFSCYENLKVSEPLTHHHPHYISDAVVIEFEMLMTLKHSI